MPGVIRGKEALRVAKILKLKVPKQKRKKKEWKPSPEDEVLAAKLRKKFGLE